MNKLLIISFDLIRQGEVETSLAIGSILAFIKNDQEYGDNFSAYHLPINMFEVDKNDDVSFIEPHLNIFNFEKFEHIAISAYIWNEYLINDLMRLLRYKMGFKGEFILGGYQISYSNQPKLDYPEGDYFINGYAEKSLLNILQGQEKIQEVDFTQIPSPYLSGELLIKPNQRMVRLETKRGCPYRCSFCAHRDLALNKVYKHKLDKVFEELSLFKEKGVGKINILDPTFNMGLEYMEVMKEMDRIGLSSLVSVQTRLEMVNKDFLDACEKLNFNLEFGLQTAILAESKVIRRANKPERIKKIMKELNEREISYEISLIYGLPTQTLESFKYSIDFVKEHGCKEITAWPLMLLKGTELHDQKKEFGLIEEGIDDWNIPLVTESNSYSKREWLEMRAIASQLLPNTRI
tara:strand:+ start:647 stop:1864 length:1218 start_codon:yes stop_codon:yes gene_type:complete